VIYKYKSIIKNEERLIEPKLNLHIAKDLKKRKRDALKEELDNLVGKPELLYRVRK
jgi:hypothetical protein